MSRARRGSVIQTADELGQFQEEDVMKLIMSGPYAQVFFCLPLPSLVARVVAGSDARVCLGPSEFFHSYPLVPSRPQLLQKRSADETKAQLGDIPRRPFDILITKRLRIGTCGACTL